MSVGECGDPLDLDQLAGVAEDRHAEQRARWAMGSEPAGHHVPHSYQLVMTTHHVDGGLHQVREGCAMQSERGLQVVQRHPRLTHGVTGVEDGPVMVEGAGTGGEEDGTGGSDCSIRVGHAFEETVGTVLRVGRVHVVTDPVPDCMVVDGALAEGADPITCHITM